VFRCSRFILALHSPPPAERTTVCCWLPAFTLRFVYYGCFRTAVHCGSRRSGLRLFPDTLLRCVCVYTHVTVPFYYARLPRAAAFCVCSVRVFCATAVCVPLDSVLCAWFCVTALHTRSTLLVVGSLDCLFYNAIGCVTPFCGSAHGCTTCVRCFPFCVYRLHYWVRLPFGLVCCIFALRSGYLFTGLILARSLGSMPLPLPYALQFCCGCTHTTFVHYAVHAFVRSTCMFAHRFTFFTRLPGCGWFHTRFYFSRTCGSGCMHRAHASWVVTFYVSAVRLCYHCRFAHVSLHATVTVRTRLPLLCRFLDFGYTPHCYTSSTTFLSLLTRFLVLTVVSRFTVYAFTFATRLLRSRLPHTTTFRFTTLHLILFTVHTRLPRLLLRSYAFVVYHLPFVTTALHVLRLPILLLPVYVTFGLSLHWSRLHCRFTAPVTVAFPRIYVRGSLPFSFVAVLLFRSPVDHVAAFRLRLPFWFGLHFPADYAAPFYATTCSVCRLSLPFYVCVVVISGSFVAFYVLCLRCYAFCGSHGCICWFYAVWLRSATLCLHLFYGSLVYFGFYRTVPALPHCTRFGCTVYHTLQVCCCCVQRSVRSLCCVFWFTVHVYVFLPFSCVALRLRAVQTVLRSAFHTL